MHRSFVALVIVAVPLVACQKKSEVVSADPVVSASTSASPSAAPSPAPSAVASVDYAPLGELALECPALGFGALGGGLGLVGGGGIGGLKDAGGDGGEGIGLGGLGTFGPGPGTGIGTGTGGHRLRPGVTGRVEKAGPGLVAQKAGAVVCTALPLFRACYARPPAALPGTLDLEIQIDAKGKVEKVVTLPKSTVAADLSKCASDALAKLTFDTTVVTTLEYHLSFEPTPRAVKMSDKGVTAKGALPPEVIKRILRANFNKFRYCFFTALAKDPKLAGKTVAQFVIDEHGAVSSYKLDPATTIGDATMNACVLGHYKGIAFPEPTTGKVEVTHTLDFAPE
ncbi:MAG: AgmX/PglI C-terminal domain-containing protein [Myxococcales bacterium]|nr:AgmX/PglI C-terminal domain-containing protein [Myxococcales bacterium]